MRLPPLPAIRHDGDRPRVAAAQWLLAIAMVVPSLAPGDATQVSLPATREASGHPARAAAGAGSFTDDGAAFATGSHLATIMVRDVLASSDRFVSTASLRADIPTRPEAAPSPTPVSAGVSLSTRGTPRLPLEEPACLAIT